MMLYERESDGRGEERGGEGGKKWRNYTSALVRFSGRVPPPSLPPSLSLLARLDYALRSLPLSGIVLPRPSLPPPFAAPSIHPFRTRSRGIVLFSLFSPPAAKL